MPAKHFDSPENRLARGVDPLTGRPKVDPKGKAPDSDPTGADFAAANATADQMHKDQNTRANRTPAEKKAAKKQKIMNSTSEDKLRSAEQKLSAFQTRRDWAALAEAWVAQIGVMIERMKAEGVEPTFGKLMGRVMADKFETPGIPTWFHEKCCTALASTVDPLTYLKGAGNLLSKVANGVASKFSKTAPSETPTQEEVPANRADVGLGTKTMNVEGNDVEVLKVDGLQDNASRKGRMDQYLEADGKGFSVKDDGTVNQNGKPVVEGSPEATTFKAISEKIMDLVQPGRQPSASQLEDNAPTPARR